MPGLLRRCRSDMTKVFAGSGREVFRQYVFDVAERLRLTPTVEGEYGGLRYLVRTQDKVIGRGIFDGSGNEVKESSQVVDLLLQNLGPGFLKGRTFVDVGANIGTTSLPAVALWGAARAIAIEPEPENYRLLRCNIIINEMENAVVAVQAAVSNTQGLVDFELALHNLGNHTVRLTDEPGAFREEDRSVIQVQAHRLDDILAAKGVPAAEVGLLWLDVEGHEGHVLDSAPSLLDQGIPVVSEFYPYALQRSRGLDLFRKLVVQNFGQIIDVRGGGSMPADQLESLLRRYADPDDYTDLILLPRS